MGLGKVLVGLFSGAEKPHVATIEKTEDGQNVQVQRITQDWDELALDASPNALDSVNTPGSESDDISCKGKSTILVKTEYSDYDVTAPFLIVLKDGNSRRIYSVKVTPANTGEQDDIQETGYYHGEGIIMPTYGADSYRVILADTPSNGGSTSNWGDAV